MSALATPSILLRTGWISSSMSLLSSGPLMAVLEKLATRRGFMLLSRATT